MINLLSLNVCFSIAISNKRSDGTSNNVFKATFEYDSSVDRFFDSTEDWCKKTLQEVNETRLEELVKTVEKAPSKNMTDLHLNSSIHFSDVSVDNVSCVVASISC